MPYGLVLLLVVAALIYFGVAQRALDRLRLTDGQALIAIALMIIGSFIDIPLSDGRVSVSVNVGGALVPLFLVVYLLIKADTTKERVRSIVAAAATAAAIWLTGRLTDFDPLRSGNMLLDPIWLFSLVGGVFGYIAGRSRRGAFIAGVGGVILADVIHGIVVMMSGVRSTVMLGGGGIFDTTILAGVVAVTFAEFFGEARELLSTDRDDPENDSGEGDGEHE